VPSYSGGGNIVAMISLTFTLLLSRWRMTESQCLLNINTQRTELVYTECYQDSKDTPVHSCKAIFCFAQ
jgi:hypothetical protein